MQQADDNNRVTVHDSFHPFPPPLSFFYPLMWAAACSQASSRADKEGEGAEIWSLGFGRVLTSPQSLPLKINNENEK